MRQAGCGGTDNRASAASCVFTQSDAFACLAGRHTRTSTGGVLRLYAVRRVCVLGGSAYADFNIGANSVQRMTEPTAKLPNSKNVGR